MKSPAPCLSCPSAGAPSKGPTYAPCRNLEKAEAAEAAAKAAGRPPRLSELLVEPSWQGRLGGEFQKQYFRQLQAFLQGEWASQAVYPPPAMIFRSGFDEQNLDHCCRPAPPAALGDV